MEQVDFAIAFFIILPATNDIRLTCDLGNSCYSDEHCTTNLNLLELWLKTVFESIFLKMQTI